MTESTTPTIALSVDHAVQVQDHEEQQQSNCMETNVDDTKCMTSPEKALNDDVVDPVVEILPVDNLETLPCNPDPNLLPVEDVDDEEDCSCTTTGTSQSDPGSAATPVHFEITPKGQVKVISEKESFL